MQQTYLQRGMLFVQLFFDNQWTIKDIQGNMSVGTKINDKQKIIKKKLKNCCDLETNVL